MKVLALNSSPRAGDQSKTGLILNHFVDGMRDAGADVELENLCEKSIKNCIGCFTCWTKTPGVCVCKDDMTDELFPKWLEADLVVYATPLYNYSMNAAMKTFIERTLPAIQPIFEMHEGRMYHPVRGKYPAAAILSVSGMPDEGHFSALSAHMRYLYSSPGRRLAAEIYRPAAEAMASPFFKQKADDILHAVRQAGRELVESMEVSPETMARIRQPFVDAEHFAVMANAIWKTCIAEKVSLQEFAEQKMIPRPDSLESFLQIFPAGLNARAVNDRKVVLQFKFSGEITEPCYFTIERGKIDATGGTSERADVTIEAPFAIWIDIMTNKADNQQMLMEQKYRVSGNVPLLMQLLVPRDPAGNPNRLPSLLP